MPWDMVLLSIDYSVRGLCSHPYPLHPKGCPNIGSKDCPPHCPCAEQLLDISKPVYAVWTVFDMVAHVERMRALHPRWSQRQLECVLYWQGRARANLKREIEAAQADRRFSKILRNPEACGINVTKTMRSIGIVLEWPVRTKAYQVAIAGESL